MQRPTACVPTLSKTTAEMNASKHHVNAKKKTNSNVAIFAALVSHNYSVRLWKMHGPSFMNRTSRLLEASRMKWCLRTVSVQALLVPPSGKKHHSGIEHLLGTAAHSKRPEERTPLKELWVRHISGDNISHEWVPPCQRLVRAACWIG